MAVSKKKGTVSKDWAVPLPLLINKDGSGIRLSGYRITWHVIIYFVGSSVLVRAALNVPGGAMDSTVGLSVFYGTCVILALFIGRRIRIKGDAKSPFFSAHLGMAGFAINTVKPIVIRNAGGPLTVSSVAVPLVALSIVAGLVYVTGQLTKRFPVTQAPAAPAAAPVALAPVAHTTAARRGNARQVSTNQAPVTQSTTKRISTKR